MNGKKNRKRRTLQRGWFCYLERNNLSKLNLRETFDAYCR